MTRLSKHNNSSRRLPIEHRDLQIVSGRVVKIQTQHIGEAVWLATGQVSQRLPTGPRLPSPTEVTATGKTEIEAIENLKHAVLSADAEPRN